MKLMIGIKLSTFSVMVSIVIACVSSLNDDVISLGGGYFYRSEGDDHKYIYYKQSNERKDIYPKVVEYVYDSTFILVAQTPIKKYSRSHLASSLNFGQQSFDELLSKADSIIANDPYYVKIFSSSINYWIIDKENNKMYGPLSKVIFESEKERLKVSSNLSLRKN